jgi:hypothetical protein
VCTCTGGWTGIPCSTPPPDPAPAGPGKAVTDIIIIGSSIAGVALFVIIVLTVVAGVIITWVCVKGRKDVAATNARIKKALEEKTKAEKTLEGRAKVGKVVDEKAKKKKKKKRAPKETESDEEPVARDPDQNPEFSVVDVELGDVKLDYAQPVEYKSPFPSY